MRVVLEILNLVKFRKTYLLFNMFFGVEPVNIIKISNFSKNRFIVRSYLLRRILNLVNVRETLGLATLIVI